MTWVELTSIGKEITLVPFLPAAVIGLPYSQTLTAVGSTAPWRIVVSSTDLPDYGTEWTITDNGDGTVTIASPDVQTGGAFTINFIVYDSDLYPAPITRRLDVIALPLMLSGDFPDAVEGNAYSASLTRTGGVAPFVYAVASGSLPTGLSLDTTTGVLSGTPTTLGTFNFTISVTDADGSIAVSDPQSIAVAVDTLALRRSLRSKTAIAHDLNGDLLQDGRTGLALTGTAAYVTGPNGVAQALSAASTSVNFTQNDLRGLNCYDARQKFTFSFFVRQTNLRAVASSALLFSLAAGGTQRINLTQNPGPATTPRPVSFLLGSQTLTTSANLPYNTWTCVQIVVDGTNITIDFDRMQAGTAALSATTVSQFTQWALGQSGGSLPAALGYDFANFVYLHDAATSQELDYLYNTGAGRPASDWMTVAYGTTPDAYAQSLLSAGDGYWKFDATSGTSAADSITGGIGALTGTNGAALNTTIDPPAGFSTADGVGETDGTNDYFSVPAISFVSGSTQYTQAIWVNPDTVNTSRRIFQFGTSFANNNDARSLNLSSAAASQLQSFIATSAGVATGNVPDSGSGVMVTASWQFVVALNQSAGLNQTIMHNGIVHRVVAGTIAPTSVNLTNNAIGGRGGTAGFAFDGKVSRALFAKGHTLTPPQIAKLYDLGVSTANQ